VPSIVCNVLFVGSLLLLLLLPSLSATVEPLLARLSLSAEKIQPK